MNAQLRPADLREARALFERRVPGDRDRFAVAWTAVEDEVEAALTDWDESEWDEDVRRFERRLRAAVSARAEPLRVDSATETELIEGVARPAAGTDFEAHEVARSCAIAAHAEGGWRVQEFRATYLPGGVLVSTSEMRTWLASHPGTGLVHWVTLEGDREPVKVDSKVAGALKATAARLESEYGWSDGLGVTFLLAGGVPIAPLLRSGVRRAGWDVLRGEVVPRQPGANEFVTLTIHPDTPVSAVAAEYSRVQSKYWTRPRLLKRRTADAVIAAHSEPSVGAANLSLGDQAYRDTATFRALVERARSRLVSLGPPVDAEQHSANLAAATERSRRREADIASGKIR